MSRRQFIVTQHSAIPATRDDIVQIVGSMISQLTAISTVVPANTNATPNVITSQYFNWENGSMHPVPEKFKFPKCNTKSLFELWYKGNPSLNIGPYRIITSADLVTQPHCPEQDPLWDRCIQLLLRIRKC